jgi:hypothetical protein
MCTMTRWSLLVVFVAGCGGGVTHRTPDEYTGCGGDEQFRLLEDGEPTATVDDTKAPQLTQPADGASVSGSVKPILKWNQDANDPGQPDGDVPYMDGVGGCNACCPQFSMGGLTTLHLPVESGNIYDVHFTVDGNYLWRLVTTLQEWTPTDALWPQLKGHKVSLQIWRMAILANSPKEGPYVATQPFTFTVGN